MRRRRGAGTNENCCDLSLPFARKVCVRVYLLEDEEEEEEEELQLVYHSDHIFMCI